MWSMELRHLRSFLMLAKEGSFRRAAEKLHIVQPALSLQIQTLENELGSPLFLRTSRHVELTPAGTAFLVEAERAVFQAEAAREAVRKAARGELGTVRIAFAGNAAVTGRLSLDMQQFRQQYPAVALELKERVAGGQAAAIDEGRLDLGYCHAHGSAFEYRLRSDVVAAWPWVVAMAAEHPLASCEAIDAAMLASENFILFGRAGEDMGQLLTLQRLLGREPNFSHQVESALAVLSLVAAGVGLTLAPQPMSRVHIPNLLFRPLAGESFLTQLILLSRPQEPSPAVSVFRDFVLATAAAAPAES
jgi:DNA-binding transcriptional LysR family regulator